MKSKHYWKKLLPSRLGFERLQSSTRAPFQAPTLSEPPTPSAATKRLAKGLVTVAQRHESRDTQPVVRYLWLYVTEDNLRHRAKRRDQGPALDLDGWLNVIDEAASLGAEWMVVYVGASLCQCPEIWRMCAWAQDEHEMRVGLHLSSACLSEDDIENLTRLDRARTYLIADAAIVSQLRPLEAHGVQLCEANVRTHHAESPCVNPAAIACVGIDGRLYSCGLVLGEQQYDLGSVLERGLRQVIEDTSLPHAIPSTHDHPEHGCDGCPPHIARRVASSLPE